MTPDDVDRLYGRIPNSVVTELWDAAEAYASIYGGETLTEDGSGMPEDPEKAIRIVTQFLKDIT